MRIKKILDFYSRSRINEKRYKTLDLYSVALFLRYKIITAIFTDIPYYSLFYHINLSVWGNYVQC